MNTWESENCWRVVSQALVAPRSSAQETAKLGETFHILTMGKDKTTRKLFEIDSDNDEVAVVNDTKPKRKRSVPPATAAPSKKTRDIGTYFSTPSKTKTSAVVTPEKESILEAKESTVQAMPPSQPVHVPKYIHKNVGYQREGDRNLSALNMKIFGWIKECCVIPNDFESNRSFGPLSGSCYEERVIRAYRLGKLSARAGVDDVMCTACGVIGHSQDECPSLL